MAEESCHAPEKPDSLRRQPGNSRLVTRLSDFNRGLRRSGGGPDNLDVPAEQLSVTTLESVRRRLQTRDDPAYTANPNAFALAVYASF
jgi:hypothetical protein